MIKKILKKIVVPICLAIVSGIICGRLIFSIYEVDDKKLFSLKKVYLIQAGAYSNYDTMVQNTSVSNYIYYEDDDGLFKSIIGITADYDNINKIKKIYSGEVIVSEYYSEDEAMNEKIAAIDEKIKNSSDEEVQKLVLEMLTFYKDSDDRKLVKITT